MSEPTAEQIVDHLMDGCWTDDRAHWLAIVRDVLAARAALAAPAEVAALAAHNTQETPDDPH